MSHHQKHFDNPLMYEADCGSSMVSSNAGVANNNNAVMGRRAASVSMDNTPSAHEYRPTCNCDDCQNLLVNYTRYDVLDAYVMQHLRYEAELSAAYGGVVPCIGGPHGNVGRRVVVDAESGEEREVVNTSMACVFFHHRHTMREVPADIKVKSHNRFYESAAAAASPSTPQQYRHHQGNATMTPPRRVSVPPHAAAAVSSHKYAPHQAVTPRSMMRQPQQQQYYNNNYAAAYDAAYHHQYAYAYHYADAAATCSAASLPVAADEQHDRFAAYTDAAYLGN